MPNKTKQQQRRVFLQAAAGIALAPVAQTEALASSLETNLLSHSLGLAVVEPGKPGDFDFLSGEWKISHRRLKNAATKEWDVFEGEATCWSILNGIASIEELRIPARNFSGMGIRLLDVEKSVWSDFWVNSRSGILTPPGVTGGFKDGVGIFISEDTDQGKPIKVRGMWDKITANSCRWQQAVSHDDGLTWEDNWVMDWRRAAK